MLGIFDNNATCSLRKPQLLIYLVLVEPCVIASLFSRLNLQYDEPTTPSHHVLLDGEIMYMGQRLEPPSRLPSSVVLGKGCALVPLLFAVPCQLEDNSSTTQCHTFMVLHNDLFAHQA